MNNAIGGYRVQNNGNNFRFDSTSLQVNPVNCTAPLHTQQINSVSENRYSIYCRGSMTVEAAIAVPLFLFFVANLLSVFLIFEQYSKNLSTLHQRARNLAILEHTINSGDEIVSLYSYQAMSPLFEYVGFDKANTVVVVKARKWTGYDLLCGNSNYDVEEYVYVTEEGSVYHKSRDCKHLQISIDVIDEESICEQRNSSGGKYYPCEKCASGNSSGLVFYTKDGKKYHNSAGCSSLKRTIKTISIKDVGDKPPCKNCG